MHRAAASRVSRRSSRRPRPGLVALAVVGGLIAAGCSDSLVVPSADSSVAVTTEAPPTTGAPATTEAPTTTEAPATTEAAPTTTESAAPAGDIEWTEIDTGIDEARIAVPLDYDDPSGDQIEIYVVRHHALKPASRIGVLFVNPGGPGYGGSDLAAQADFIYGKGLLDTFDIIGFDPRGTGLSEPHVDCVDDYDPYFGVETGPDDAAEDAALQTEAAEFTAACADRSGDLLQHVSTVEAATDMDTIRQALGEDEVSYFGWSYGTHLGSVWATLFPDTVRAAVLDGAIDPTVGRIDGLVFQASGFDASLSTFLADCSGDTTCPFHNGGDAEGAFLDLLSTIETSAVPTADGRPDLNQGVFELGVAQALYSDSLWPQLAQALADAQAGDGAGMLQLYDEYYGRNADGSYGDELEAYFAITCADEPSVGGAAGIAQAVDVRGDFYVASPRIGTSAAYEVLICASFPSGSLGDGTADFQITGDGAGPIVVVGNTGDPATPFEGSRRMAESLEEGVFVEVEADQHTAYGLNACINNAIDQYLIKLTVPEGVTC